METTFRKAQDAVEGLLTKGNITADQERALLAFNDQVRGWSGELAMASDQDLDAFAVWTQNQQEQALAPLLLAAIVAAAITLYGVFVLGIG